MRQQDDEAVLTKVRQVFIQANQILDLLRDDGDFVRPGWYLCGEGDVIENGSTFTTVVMTFWVGVVADRAPGHDV